MPHWLTYILFFLAGVVVCGVIVYVVLLAGISRMFGRMFGW